MVIINEPPRGLLVPGILASTAEFYSLNLTQEALKGRTQSAAIGGTPTEAPLGYLNVLTTDARGRESREIGIDPERDDAETERTYQRNSVTPTQAEHVRKVLNDAFNQFEGSSEDKHTLLTTQRDKLETERLKLVDAHYTDAIPLNLFKKEGKNASSPASTRSRRGSTSSPTPTPRRKPA